MKCPNCNLNLEMADRNGVEIDYCPDCRGVWLDRGELDKIIAHSLRNFKDTPSDEGYRQKHNYSDNINYGHKKKKRDSFLGDLFDF